MYKFKLKENSEFEVGDVKVKDGKKSTVTDINPVTGAVSWDIVNVGAFDTVYKTFDKLNKLLRTLESEGEAESDPTIDSITDQVKKLFNQYRTHVRKNYPEAYDRIRMVKESVNEDSAGTMVMLKTGAYKDTRGVTHTLKRGQRGRHERIGWDGDFVHFGNLVFDASVFDKTSIEVYESVKEGEGIGYLTPRAFDKNKSSTGAKDIYYYKLGFKPVPKKIKGAGTIVKQLFEKEELTEYSDFQQKRINIFDDVEEKINSISPLLSNAKNETAQYYNENPGSYAIVYSTDMVNELLDDITKLLKQGEWKKL